MKPNTDAREIHVAHIYSKDAIAEMPSAIRTAERLGHNVEIEIRRDGMGRIHSLQCFAIPPEKKE